MGRDRNRGWMKGESEGSKGRQDSLVDGKQGDKVGENEETRRRGRAVVKEGRGKAGKGEKEKGRWVGREGEKEPVEEEEEEEEEESHGLAGGVWTMH